MITFINETVHQRRLMMQSVDEIVLSNLTELLAHVLYLSLSHEDQS